MSAESRWCSFSSIRRGGGKCPGGAVFLPLEGGVKMEKKETKLVDNINFEEGGWGELTSFNLTFEFLVFEVFFSGGAVFLPSTVLAPTIIGTLQRNAIFFCSNAKFVKSRKSVYI